MALSVRKGCSTAGEVVIKGQGNPGTAQILVLCLSVFILSVSVTWGVFAGMPHLEDEHANYYQAKVLASGKVVNTVQQPHEAFAIPYVIVIDGKEFIKYPPGYPLLLSIGMAIGMSWLVNAVLAVAAILACYLLGSYLFGHETGLLAAGLGALSPSFILLSGAFLSNMATLAELTLFAWAFLRARSPARQTQAADRRDLFALAAGGLAGLGLITRPFTATAICLPFAVLALVDLARRRGEIFPTYLRMGLAFVLVGLLLPAYNYAATGSPITNTYKLWWNYDSIGFGPDVGRNGHDWQKVLINLRADFPIFGQTVLGWPVVFGVASTWILLGLGLFMKPINRRDWLLLVPPLALIVAHFAYWAHSGGLYGVRYYTEALPYLWILGARLLLKLSQWKVLRRLAKLALPVFILWGIVFVTAPRLQQGRNLYDISRQDANTIAAAQLQHALVFVRVHYWTDYANLSWLNNSDLASSAIIYAKDRGSKNNQDVIQHFPGRTVYYYDHTQEPPLSPYPVPPG